MSLLSDQLADTGFEVRTTDMVRSKSGGKVKTMTTIGENVDIHIQPLDGDITLGTISGKSYLMIIERSALTTDLPDSAQIVFGTDIYDILSLEEYPTVQMLPRHYQLVTMKVLKN